MRYARGFTLLELLVAVSVFAVVAVMAYGGLHLVLGNSRDIERQAQTLAALQTTFSYLQRDIEQSMPRPMRDELGESRPAFLGHDLASAASGMFMEFTRGGYRAPGTTVGGSLQRVAYAFREGNLERMIWEVLDRAEDSAPAATVLVQDVDAVSVRFLDQEGNWTSDWSAQQGPGGDDVLPRAVEIGIEVNGWGRVTRLLPVAG